MRLFLFLSIVLIACNNSGSNSSKVDTIYTVAEYAVGLETRKTRVMRLEKDSTYLKTETKEDGSIITKNVKEHGFYYYIPMNDTVRDINGKPVFDSLRGQRITFIVKGKDSTVILYPPKMEIRLFPIDRKLVYRDENLKL